MTLHRSLSLAGGGGGGLSEAEVQALIDASLPTIPLPEPLYVTMLATSGLTLSNLGAAETEMLGQTTRRFVDLSKYDRARFHATRSGGSVASGTSIKLQGSTDGSSWSDISAALDISTGTSIVLDSIVTLPVGLRTEVYLRLVTAGGDGIQDPQMGSAGVVFTKAAS